MNVCECVTSLKVLLSLKPHPFCNERELKLSLVNSALLLFPWTDARRQHYLKTFPAQLAFSCFPLSQALASKISLIAFKICLSLPLKDPKIQFAYSCIFLYYSDIQSTPGYSGMIRYHKYGYIRRLQVISVLGGGQRFTGIRSHEGKKYSIWKMTEVEAL